MRHSPCEAAEVRAQVAQTCMDTSITLRLSKEDRALLDKLVALRISELGDIGVELTISGYLRALIRREANAHGLSTNGEATEP